MGEESTSREEIWRRLMCGDFTNPPEVTVAITLEESVQLLT